MLERSRIIRPSVEDIFYIDQLNDELRRDPLSWQREWLRRVPRLELAFPSVNGTRTTGQTSSGTTHNISLPSGIIAGELLVVFLRSINDDLGGASGWTKFLNDVNGGGTGVRLTGYWKIAAGSDPLTVTTSSNRVMHTIAFRISGHHPTFPVYQATDKTESLVGNADPPNLDPGVGALDFLWIALSAVGASSGTPAAPTNYSNLTIVTPSSFFYSAERTLNAASENPGAFTGGTQSWVSGTVAIRPAPAVPLFMHHYRQMRGN